MQNDYLKCEDEPIHIPNFIQPIGYFIVFDLNSLSITHLSQNFLDDFQELNINSNIRELLPNIDNLITEFKKHSKCRLFFYHQKINLHHKSTKFDIVLSNIYQDEFILEIIPLIHNENYEKFNITSLSENIFNSRCLDSLFQNITDYIRNYIGYDRVMIYKFDNDFNGRVIYESKIDSLESYLDLHYPASDIPAQARELYLKNNIRVIYNSDYIPSTIITDSTTNIDMSCSFLRSVSPIHLEYMKNMGVYASMTISLVIDNKLWGLIACHHQVPHIASIKMINDCEYIGKISSSMIRILEDKRLDKDYNQFSGKLDTLMEIFQKQSFYDLDELLVKNILHLDNLFNSDGFILFVDSYINYIDIELEKEEINDMTHKLIKIIENGDYFYSESILKTLPNLDEKIQSECAGLLAIKISENPETYLFWTKKEQEKVITWGGNPGEKIKKPDHKYLSPRNSFEKYVENVRYTSKDWDDNILEKIELLVSKFKNFNSSFSDKLTINTQNKKIIALENEKEKHNSQLVDLLLRIIEERDAYTAGHTLRVANLCVLIANEMNIDEYEIALLKEAAKLHDIGKIVIPDSVLLKPEKLNHSEYDIIQLHLIVGYKMLSTIDYYKPMAEIMKYHHEKYDGTGYPYKIRGDQIPILSHIMIVADAFDAMTSNRIYQKRKTFEKALEEILSLKSVWYHPKVVDALVKVKQKKLIESSKSSQIPLTKMEHERFSYFFKDQMTGFYNEPYLWMILNNQIPNYSITDFFIIELHGLSQYNKLHGWHNGNIAINNISKVILKKFENELIFRVFGDDFTICFTSHDKYLNKIKEWKEIKIANIYTSSRPIKKTAFIEELQSMW